MLSAEIVCTECGMLGKLDVNEDGSTSFYAVHVDPTPCVHGCFAYDLTACPNWNAAYEEARRNATDGTIQ